MDLHRFVSICMKAACGAAFGSDKMHIGTDRSGMLTAEAVRSGIRVKNELVKTNP